MLDRILKSTVNSINNVAEPLLVKAITEVLKPLNAVADPEIMDAFEKLLSKEVETFQVKSEDRILVAHKLSLKKQNATHKKAIIYVCGNGEYVASVLPGLLPLFKDILAESNKLYPNVNYALYCQDYRGRGYNKAHPDEHFNQYPIGQDAKDQAALITKILEEGYAPSDILLIGHSLGSAVSLWACNKLIKDRKECENIKVYSDRGYGNLLEHPVVKPFLNDEKQTSGKLQAAGMLPLRPLHDIALRLNNSFITRTDSDSLVVEAVSLASTFKDSELKGRVWVNEVIDADEKSLTYAHNAGFSELQSKGIPQLKPHHFITAMIHQVPIQLIDAIKLPDINGYVLRNNARPGDNGFVSIPKQYLDEKELLAAKKDGKCQSRSIKISSSASLISSLNQYCLTRSEEAKKSAYGEHHKRWLMGQWDAKQQVEAAVKIMNALAGDQSPSLQMFEALSKESGPHTSGELNKLYIKAMNYAIDWHKLQAFNQWINSMPKVVNAIEKTSKDEKPVSLSALGIFRRIALVAGGIGGALLTGGLGGGVVLGAVGYFSPEIAGVAADKVSECCGNRKVKKP